MKTITQIFRRGNGEIGELQITIAAPNERHKFVDGKWNVNIVDDKIIATNIIFNEGYLMPLVLCPVCNINLDDEGQCSKCKRQWVLDKEGNMYSIRRKAMLTRLTGEDLLDEINEY